MFGMTFKILCSDNKTLMYDHYTFVESIAGIQCSFSVQDCGGQCPLGYESDKYGCPISCKCATKGFLESDISFNPNTIKSLLSVSLKVLY